MKKILTKRQFAERIGRSVRHLERLISVGEGPPLVQARRSRCRDRRRRRRRMDRRAPRRSTRLARWEGSVTDAPLRKRENRAPD